MFTDSNTFNKLFENANVATIAGEQFNIPSFENMLALKLHSIKYNPHRELHDLPDIVNLTRVNNYKYKTEHFRILCEKFGNTSLYNKILEYLEGNKDG